MNFKQTCGRLNWGGEYIYLGTTPQREDVWICVDMKDIEHWVEEFSALE